MLLKIREKHVFAEDMPVPTLKINFSAIYILQKVIKYECKNLCGTKSTKVVGVRG